ncbi:MAG: amidohydrolase family protein [Propionibacteriaceae bacterium]
MPIPTASLPPGARMGIRADRLFDGAGVFRHGRPWLVMEAGRIVGVETTRAEPPSDLPVRDLGAATVLPGLIDTHTHLVFDATSEAAAHVQTARTPELLDQMRTAARSMLAVGITTARDVGDRDYLSLRLRAETAERADAGPTLLVAGPPLTSTQGHCWFLGGEVDPVDGIAAAIREHAERGVDLIKVMTTGGRMTHTTLPHESQFTAEELRAAVDVAHELGLPIAAHAHGRQGIVDSLRAGFDTLEHVSFLTDVSAEPDQEVIDEIAAAEVPASVTAGQLPGAPLAAALAAAVPAMLAHLVNLHRSGVRITFGPDGGISPSKPHHVLPYAVDQLVGAGLGVRDALVAATSAGAQAIGLGHRKGRLAPGYDADLLVVDGDPFADISAVHRPLAVYRHGVLVGSS